MFPFLITFSFQCQTCATGKYQAGVGNSGCVDCTIPLPEHGIYIAWTTPATSNTCPIACNAGFIYQGSVCVKCGTGKHKNESQSQLLLTCFRQASTRRTWFAPTAPTRPARATTCSQQPLTAKPTRVHGTVMQATTLTLMREVAFRAGQECPFPPPSESRRTILQTSAPPAKHARMA